MTDTSTQLARVATVTALLTASGLHLAWGAGSTFPFSSTAALTDHVIGAARTPSRSACYTVTTGLAGAAALLAVPNLGVLRRRVLTALAVVFGTRALFGFAGRTDLLVPGSTSAAFRRNDRWLFSPVCAGLTLGVLATLRRRRGQ